MGKTKTVTKEEMEKFLEDRNLQINFVNEKKSNPQKKSIFIMRLMLQEDLDDLRMVNTKINLVNTFGVFEE